MTAREKAMTPEDLTRLFVERSNAGDADGVAALYEEHAVLAYPPGSQTAGREAIRACGGRAGQRPAFEPETPLPTLVSDELALTSTPLRDGAGARAQVVRRQPDGSGCACWTSRSSPTDSGPGADRRRLGMRLTGWR